MNMNFQPDLIAWYQREHRDLPFRQKKDPYSIWVSEIMAQQTRIEAMLEKYTLFMDTYPTIESLAQADEDGLMQVWQGLGYYSRARNLKKAAQTCMEACGGKLPSTKKELKKLPGIGDYTAGAIASIAFGQNVSAIDGNVIRVFSRLFHIDQDVTQKEVKKKLEDLVEVSLPGSDLISDYNQALMELGALVCIPKYPRCEICPVSSCCQAFKKGDAASLPVKKEKKPRSAEIKTVYIPAAWDEQSKEWFVKIQKRPGKGLLAGLYEFPQTAPQYMEKKVPLKKSVHIFSHKEWHMEGYLVYTRKEEDFVPWTALVTDYALPSAFMPFYTQAQEILYGKTR